MNISSVIREAVRVVPSVKPYLGGRALAFVFNIDPEYKTQAFFQGTIEHLIKQVYSGNMGGDFIDIMANLIQGQLTDAYNQAWEDDNNTLPLPNYLSSKLESDILRQYDFVDGFYRDIVDARVDNTSIDPLLSRATMWANQWDAAYNSATLAINTESGGKLQWHKGNTEHGCETCAQLDGIVAYASEWDELGVHPQGYPNDKLACGGGGPGNFCDCSLDPTDRRRSPDAFTTIMDVVQATI